MGVISCETLTPDDSSHRHLAWLEDCMEQVMKDFDERPPRPQSDQELDYEPTPTSGTLYFLLLRNSFLSGVELAHLTVRNSDAIRRPGRWTIRPHNNLRRYDLETSQSELRVHTQQPVLISTPTDSIDYENQVPDYAILKFQCPFRKNPNVGHLVHMDDNSVSIGSGREIGIHFPAEAVGGPSHGCGTSP
ncbi:hypothetical protein L2E82_17417 [Cichorium intybus]|uniref:Uncharacterized protein n=1 Tax=Cichorium intybus TaxID=13427 RepID=A0ACB9F9H1_CICIN|nr:hypothetical protein L2E82_17417 [Cichorium intybus]